MANLRREYEQAFGKLVGVHRVRAFSLARHGLLVLLKALGVGKGDRVGVCGFSCIMVTEPVRLAGAMPVYLDVDEHACIDPAAIRRHKPGSLKVVILQHTFGAPGRLDELLAACKDIGARVVEDSAHALGCTWKGQPLGSFGEGTVYSQGWSKPYALGRGGMLTVNSDALLAKVDDEIRRRALPESGRAGLVMACQRRIYDGFVRLGAEETILAIAEELKRRGLMRERFEIENDFRLYRGYVRIAGNTTCRAGLQQLRAWSGTEALRRRNTELIEDHLRRAGLPRWPVPAEADAVIISYPLLVSDKPGAMTLARRRKVSLSDYYQTPVHPLKGDDLARVGYEVGSCPQAERMTRHVVHISTISDNILGSVELLIRLARSRPTAGADTLTTG